MKPSPSRSYLALAKLGSCQPRRLACCRDCKSPSQTVSPPAKINNSIHSLEGLPFKKGAQAIRAIAQVTAKRTSVVVVGRLVVAIVRLYSFKSGTTVSNVTEPVEAHLVEKTCPRSGGGRLLFLLLIFSESNPAIFAGAKLWQTWKLPRLASKSSLYPR